MNWPLNTSAHGHVARQRNPATCRRYHTLADAWPRAGTIEERYSSSRSPDTASRSACFSDSRSIVSAHTVGRAVVVIVLHPSREARRKGERLSGNRANGAHEGAVQYDDQR